MNSLRFITLLGYAAWLAGVYYLAGFGWMLLNAAVVLMFTAFAGYYALSQRKKNDQH